MTLTLLTYDLLKDVTGLLAVSSNGGEGYMASKVSSWCQKKTKTEEDKRSHSKGKTSVMLI